MMSAEYLSIGSLKIYLISGLLVVGLKQPNIQRRRFLFLGLILTMSAQNVSQLIILVCKTRITCI